MVVHPREESAAGDALEDYQQHQAAQRPADGPGPGLCVVRVLVDRAPELQRALNGVRSIVRESPNLPAPAQEVV